MSSKSTHNARSTWRGIAIVYER